MLWIDLCECVFDRRANVMRFVIAQFEDCGNRVFRGGANLAKRLQLGRRNMVILTVEAECLDLFNQLWNGGPRSRPDVSQRKEC